MTYLYLVKRGPRPEHHKAPFHPVIICDNRKIAKWEAGATHDRATIWERSGSRNNGFGWLIVRWNGFDIDYGPVVGETITLPDGTETGFYRDYDDQLSVKDLLPGAVWWSHRPMPEWLQERGVVYPPDAFSQQDILDSVATDNFRGFGRPRPEFWPEGIKDF